MKNRTVDFVLLLKLRIPLLLLAGMVWYGLVLSNTWAEYTAYRNLRNTAGQETASVSRDFTGRRAGEVDLLYARMEVDTLRWKNALWNYASELSAAHTSSLNGFPPLERFSAGGQSFLKQTVAFKGHYKDLMQIMKALSQRQHMGLIQHIRMVKKARDKDIVLTIDMAGKAKD